MTGVQLGKLHELLVGIGGRDGGCVLHHCDYVGAAAQAHLLVKKLGWRVMIHPPVSTLKRAYCVLGEGDVLGVPLEFVTRMQYISDVCDMIVCAPATLIEQVSSGTWSMIKNACARGRELYVLWPHGTVTRRTAAGQTVSTFWSARSRSTASVDPMRLLG